MTTKWLHKTTARKCPVHQAVTERAGALLARNGCFRKDKVLSDINLSTMAESIRWDYIRLFLEEDQGCELVPVAETYFKKHTMAEEFLSPEKFIASGHGKKTAGFCAVNEYNDHLVICRVKQRKHMANGVGKKFYEYLEAINDKRIANDQEVIEFKDEEIETECA